MNLIDRYKLIEALEEEIRAGNEYLKDNPNEKCEELYLKGVRYALTVALSQPQVNQWIPCKERLPKLEKHFTSKTVAILIDWDLDGTLEVGTGELVGDTWFGYTVSGDRIDMVDNEKIIAWCELPKPYEEEENVD